MEVFLVVKIAIIVGSTRPGRNSEAVARWVHDIARQRGDAEFEVVDIAAFNLPLLDEPQPAMMGQYTKPHTKVWSEKIASFDGFVFVTGEYNFGMPAALKNALDYLYREWNHKAAGFVSIGGAGGSRAVVQLRQVMAALQIAHVAADVQLSLYTDFENFSVFKPHPRHEAEVGVMLDQVITWSGATKTLRPQPAPMPAANEGAAAGA
ncbi:MAG TPA: NAD(P)H-dependent oxidoreductase [Bacillota bacterium]|nr:NAD(P)H-dependent oxidoreductase [Bacillota bacterium]